jgi:DNA-binding CsgD family transcriptional regulator
MKILSVIWWIFLISGGVFAIILSLKMYQRYRIKYLLYYTIFLIFSYAYAFLDVIADYIAQGILISRLSPYQTVRTVSLVFSLLAFPFIILAWFFFISLVREWLGKILALGYKIGYFVLQVLFVVVYAYSIDQSAVNQSAFFSDTSSWIIFIFNTVNHAILFLVIFQLFRQSKKKFEPDMQRAARMFGFLYFLGFVLHYAFLNLSSKTYLFFCYGYPYVEFLMHLPPLLYLYFFFKKYYQTHPLQPVNGAELSKFLSRFGISKRELEIIILILKGKSNRDIEDELFISIKTVKTHIYNIYRKLGVKNRWQLFNLVNNVNGTVS